ncbi:hypothetical protein CWN85_10080 [Vibrio splendidus]|uniref:hypothetical protein n=1 Tax=Vibrio splendidus TaxID=29497 RepID=UPI000D3D8F99|nr:hypothetical protein [Vibrio splendidus]PTP09573.1 hypothetical protein CWN86_02725 [Vibrio splendidus]PTP23883.1 hypothetical protein CWN85_10080 [Vibrio splendidus]
MDISILAAIAAAISGVASLISQWLSARKLERKRKEYDELIQVYKEKISSDKLGKNDPEFYKKWTEVVARSVVEQTTSDVVTYKMLLHLNKNIRMLGRASSLNNKSSFYKHMWVFLNSGLVNTVLDNSIKSDSVSEIDKSTVIGMLLGDRMQKDTKSFIYLAIALLASFLFPLVSGLEMNFWVVGAVLVTFSLLTLNHKIIEYRVSKGYYGSNEYEVREIISYIERHSDPDDFDSTGRKKVFQADLPEDNKEFVGLIEGLTA